MKPKKLNTTLIWKQMEDQLVPRLPLSTTDRAVYSHLLRHSRLEGREEFRFSIRRLARHIHVSDSAVRNSVRRLADRGALRLVERNKAGHVVEVRLPEEIPLGSADGIEAREPKGLPSAVNLEETDFMQNQALGQTIHAREGGHCFYCLRRTDAHAQCLDHVVPKAKAGRNSYRNLVSCCLECNSLKGERSAPDFLRWLFRDRRLTASELHAGLSRLDALAAGKLPPPVQHPDTPLGAPNRKAVPHVTARPRLPLGTPAHILGRNAAPTFTRATKACHSERSRPTFSSAFAPANASACAAKNLSSIAPPATNPLPRRGRPRGSRSGL